MPPEHGPDPSATPRTYIQLSEVVALVSNPQATQAYMTRFVRAANKGTFKAFVSAERFDLPKIFTRQGTRKTYRRQVRDYLISSEPAFWSWHADTLLLLEDKRFRPPPLSPEAAEQGHVDFSARCQATRRDLEMQRQRPDAINQQRRKRR